MNISEVMEKLLIEGSPFRGKANEKIKFDIDRFMLLVDNPILRSEQVRCAIKGRKVDEKKYEYTTSLGRKTISNSVSSEKISQLLFRGATVTIDSLEYLLPELMFICEEVKKITGYNCTATAYFTGPGERGLLPHIDEEEVVMFQVAGSKKWIYSSSVYDELAIPRAIADAELSSINMKEYNLESGHFLALPSGTVHAGETNDDYSIHVTFSVEKSRNSDRILKFINHANELMLNDEKFLERSPFLFKDALKDYLESLSEISFEESEKKQQKYLPDARSWFLICEENTSLKFSGSCIIERDEDEVLVTSDNGSMKLSVKLFSNIENIVNSGKYSNKDKKISYTLMKMVSLGIIEVG